MTSHPGAQRFLPERGSLSALRAAAAHCEGCDLFEPATQTVFGAGPARARLVLVGEQPGDQEDKAGEPFVGPAGHLLDRAMADAALDDVPHYRTNAVKHFRFTIAERGKRRIHQAPNRGQLRACLPWLTAELVAIRPRLVVCLGATAAHALFGPDFRLTQHRGDVLTAPESMPGRWEVMATVHPSSVLRAKDRDQAYTDFVADLRAVAGRLR
ncbi:MAG TPA: UdgX family uracil-DNA binding protein [Pseudonocardiaceae bacterium]|jgi:DNA polymerase|nr:UdgX family uracil-DNA binding protein [Pseudonocardiaceae bacterium]